VTLPPHDLEAETVVLSAVLWGDLRASELRLRARAYWAPEHQQMWAALLSIEEQPWPAPLGPGARLAAAIRVLEQLGAGRWHERLVEIMGLTGDADRCTEIVRRKARERWLIRHMQRIEHLLRQGVRPSARLLDGTAAALGAL
jgi:replicative DNA helicase